MSVVQKFIRFCETEFGKQIIQKEAAYIHHELKNYNQILDVGCGIGTFEQRLSPLNITGFDISGDMLTEARKRSKRHFIKGDAEQLPFDDKTFDAVFTVATLEFVNDYKQAIHEIARVTTPKGKLVAMILNPKSEYFQTEVLKPGDYFTRMKHLDLHEMRDHISKLYTITKTEYLLGIRDNKVFNTVNERYASLYVIVGLKKQSSTLLAG